MALFARKDRIPIPLKDAQKFTTVCQYCNVGCGYYVYRWPVGKEGGLKPEENALGIDFSKQGVALQTQSITETMYNRVGDQFMPVSWDEAIEFPSVWTNIHTYRRFKATRRGLRASMSPGSTLSPHNLSERLVNALRAYFFGGFLSFPTWDKNKYSTPHPVVKGKKLDVCLYKTTRSDTGFKDPIARVVKGVKDKWGPDSIAMKIHDHGGAGAGFEDNWAVGKFFFIAVGTRMLSIHNRPAYNSEVWKQRERGVHELNYTYEDARLADTIVLWGTNPFETASVFYTEHMLPNLQGATIEEKKKEYLKGEPAEPARMMWTLGEPPA